MKIIEINFHDLECKCLCLCLWLWHGYGYGMVMVMDFAYVCGCGLWLWFCMGHNIFFKSIGPLRRELLIPFVGYCFIEKQKREVHRNKT